MKIDCVQRMEKRSVEQNISLFSVGYLGEFGVVQYERHAYDAHVHVYLWWVVRHCNLHCARMKVHSHQKYNSLLLTH